jgi:hypothetical protein
MNLTGRPIYAKGQKADKPRKGMRPVSAKKAKHKASAEGKADAAYLSAVHQLPCICGCGKICEEAHHCKDQPPHDYNDGMGPYERLACAGRKSADRDTIPICREAHHMYHRNRPRFHALYGFDYEHIEWTRKKVAAM